MKLAIIGADSSEESIRRGIAAAQDFFNTHRIIPNIVYQD